MLRRVGLAVIATLLFTAPVSAQFVTKRFTFYGCSEWVCHTANFTLIGTGEGYNRLLEVYRYSVTSRYRKSGIPRMFAFDDTTGIFPLINDSQSPVQNSHFGREIFEPFMIMIYPGRWRPESMGVEDVLGPEGTFFGGTNGDFVGFTALYVTPEPASLLLLGTGLAGIAGAAFRRRRAA